MTEKAVVLLSGGLDSTTALYWALRVKKWRCVALLFDYGQRHKKELGRARLIAKNAGCPVTTVSLHLPWGGSRLLDHKPLPRTPLALIGKKGIPSTYVPARNTIFLSYALSLMDTLNARHAVIGANVLDYSGYPDCRPRYLSAMEHAGRLGTRLGTQGKKIIKIWAPLLKKTKQDIVRAGIRWGAPLGLTWSCYAGGVRPCGRCDSCQLRAEGFRLAGLADPANLVSSTNSRP